MENIFNEFLLDCNAYVKIIDKTEDDDKINPSCSTTPNKSGNSFFML